MSSLTVSSKTPEIDLLLKDSVDSCGVTAETTKKSVYMKTIVKVGLCALAIIASIGLAIGIAVGLRPHYGQQADISTKWLAHLLDVAGTMGSSLLGLAVGGIPIGISIAGIRDLVRQAKHKIDIINEMQREREEVIASPRTLPDIIRRDLIVNCGDSNVSMEDLKRFVVSRDLLRLAIPDLSKRKRAYEACMKEMLPKIKAMDELYLTTMEKIHQKREFGLASAQKAYEVNVKKDALDSLKETGSGALSSEQRRTLRQQERQKQKLELDEECAKETSQIEVRYSNELSSLGEAFVASVKP